MATVKVKVSLKATVKVKVNLKATLKVKVSLKRNCHKQNRSIAFT